MLTIVMDLPPSTNHLFRNVAGRGRVNTSAYLAWVVTAGLKVREAVAEAGRPAISGRWWIIIKADARNRDLDNLAKPILDLLVAQQVVPDDRYCDRVTIEREADVFGAHVTVGPMRVGAEAAA